MIKERYSLESALDQVRFGTLYRAIDREQSRYVGLWLLPAELGRNPGALEAFKRDFARIRLLTHPNIARICELDHDGERYFVITEFLDGETLRNVLDHLRPERLDCDEADAIVTAIGAGLAHAHDRGIVHGDIRAENVLVTMSREFKLLNFMSTNVLRYAPFAARPGDDVRDLAALAYELYTGYAPHTTRPVRLKGLPRQRWYAIEAALTRGPRAARTADEFLASAGLSEAAAPAFERPRGPLPAAARVAPPRSRWRLGVPALGVAIVGAAFFAAGGMHWMNSAGSDLKVALQDLEARTPEDRAAAVLAESTQSAQQSAPPQAENAEAAAPESHVAEEPRPAEQRVLPVAAVLRERAGAAPPTRLGAANNGNDSTVTTVSLSAAALTVRENQHMATIDIVRAGPLDRPVEVIWWTADGTANARDDYAAFGRRLETLPAGQAALTLHIPIGADATAETDEYFYVNLDSRPTGARIGGFANAKITIIDDDR
jgi:hypothetical protein